MSVGNGLLTDRYFTATFQVKSGVGFGYFAQCRLTVMPFTGMVKFTRFSVTFLLVSAVMLILGIGPSGTSVLPLASGLSMAFTWSGRMIVASPSYRRVEMKRRGARRSLQL
ncbi:MAG: hypothetical protein ACLUDU_17415 [Butyricimonas faecihominis]